VAGYKIFRGATQIATSASTSYSDAGLSPSTTYTYSVSAYDPAGNTSAQSLSVSATTQAAAPPPTSPSAPTSPSVAIGTPSNGATVSGTIMISANAGGSTPVAGVQFFIDGAALAAELPASPYQMSWNTMTAANGIHTLTAAARNGAGNRTTSAGVNVNVTNSTPASPPQAQRSPFHGTPFAVPGHFEAEDFDKGGEGVAYHDLTPGNQGGAYRLSEDVDIISPYPLGYVITDFQTGEWLEYTINVVQTGTYKIEALVSSPYATSRFHIEVDRVDVTGLINVPNTGYWGNFQWVGKSGISLTAGQHILRMYADAQYFNLDAFNVSVEAVAGRWRASHH
jgi:chitodextrinase